MPIAYLNSEYPSLSHTFIEREVRQVRAQGLDVITFSIRRPGRTGTIGSAHARAARETRYVLDGGARLIGSIARGLATNPLATIRTILSGQRLSPPGLGARVWHLAYAIEAIRLAQMLAHERVRHVHVHMANNGASIALLATRYNPRLSYSLTVHGPSDFYHVEPIRLRQKAENALFVRCISDFCRSQVMTWTDPTHWDRLHVVRCGIDTGQFRPADRDAQGPIRLLTIGRLDPIKGQHILLESCAQLDAMGVDWCLNVIGDGSLRADLECKAGSLGIADRVTFQGAVSQDDIRRHLDAADAMVLSSFNEGVPVVLMEAMACGLPVIATRVGGMHELVEDGVSGLLVHASSVGSLAEAIRTLAQDADRRRAMGEAGRLAVVAKYDIAQTASGMVDVFDGHVESRVSVGEQSDPRDARAPVIPEPNAR